MTCQKESIGSCGLPPACDEPGIPDFTEAVVAASSSKLPGMRDEWGSLSPWVPVVDDVGLVDEDTGWSPPVRLLPKWLP